MPNHIVEAAQRARDEGHTHYTHLLGAPDLRWAIAEKLERDNGIHADPETEILVTTGAREVVCLVVQALLDVGELLIPDPHYTSTTWRHLSPGHGRSRSRPTATTTSWCGARRSSEWARPMSSAAPAQARSAGRQRPAMVPFSTAVLPPMTTWRTREIWGCSATMTSAIRPLASSPRFGASFG